MKWIGVAIILIVAGVWYWRGTLKLPTKVSPVETVQEQMTTGEMKIEEVARGLSVPWAIVFAGENRLLVTERPGKITEIKNGVVNKTPLIVFPEVVEKSEDGLMGLTSDGQYLYACLAYQKGSGLVNKIVRLRDEKTKIEVDEVIVDDLPSAANHAGCRIKLGPDKRLYITVGDATKKNLAQDQNSYAGKMIRVNTDGSNLEIYSSGHRNSQGFDWHPKTGEIWATEHGPSGFDGPGGGDEINILKQGGNYGWPLLHHVDKKAGFESPIAVFTPAVAPAGAAFWNGEFYFAGLKGEGIWKVNPDGTSVKLPNINYGRIRELIVGPDSALYFSTSNTDGRGKPKEGDDKIYRLTW